MQKPHLFKLGLNIVEGEDLHRKPLIVESQKT
jgi:hypothetical protein